VREECRTLPLPWPGAVEQLRECFQEVSAPFCRLIDGVEPERRELAISEIDAAVRRYYDGQQVNFPGLVVVASGER
jgi:hypothetical protein